VPFDPAAPTPPPGSGASPTDPASSPAPPSPPASSEWEAPRAIGEGARAIARAPTPDEAPVKAPPRGSGIDPPPPPLPPTPADPRDTTTAAAVDATAREAATVPALGRIGNHAGLSGEWTPEDDGDPPSRLEIRASPPSE
jgi:hypothetical protein